MKTYQAKQLKADYLKETTIGHLIVKMNTVDETDKRLMCSKDKVSIPISRWN